MCSSRLSCARAFLILVFRAAMIHSRAKEQEIQDFYIYAKSRLSEFSEELNDSDSKIYETFEDDDDEDDDYEAYFHNLLYIIQKDVFKKADKLCSEMSIEHSCSYGMELTKRQIAMKCIDNGLPFDVGLYEEFLNHGFTLNKTSAIIEPYYSTISDLIVELCEEKYMN